MAVRPLFLPVTEEAPSLRYSKAPPSQTEYDCPICGKPVEINTSKDEAASKAMHEGCYVLREMLKHATTQLLDDAVMRHGLADHCSRTIR